MHDIAIVWFREDLRLLDNPALYNACKEAKKIIPVFILDETSADIRKMGGASKWWLHQSLQALSKELPLVLKVGDSVKQLQELVQSYGASAVYYNDIYQPNVLARDKALQECIDVEFKSYNSSLLKEPGSVLTQQGEYYGVYTPFKNCYWRDGVDRKPVKKVEQIELVPGVDSLDLDELDLLPQGYDWAAKMEKHWEPGEQGALSRFDKFIERAVFNYADTRNMPAKDGVSKLSPHLHFGEISPLYIWHEINFIMSQHSGSDEGLVCYLNEIIWREFGYHLLSKFPQLPSQNYRSKFDNFPWVEDQASFLKWKEGKTGFPIVDAGMRELWETGFMHNRVRMIVASFLIKDLFIHWKEGEAWFWDTLVDADLASNSSNWQWVAGSGADAAPYFRIFNPTTQGERFDPQGEYIKKWVPELKNVPVKHVHQPHKFEGFGGLGYPKPMVDHKQRRELALKYFENLE